MPTDWNSYFYRDSYGKTYLTVYFTKGCLFSNLWRKSYAFRVKVLLGCCRYKSGLYFFLNKDKNE